MSTHLFLQCLDHDPVITAPDSSGSSLRYLPEIRRDIASRELLLTTYDLGIFPKNLNYYRLSTLYFLSQHRKCNLGIIDEYGGSHSLTEEEVTSDGSEATSTPGESDSEALKR